VEKVNVEVEPSKILVDLKGGEDPNLYGDDPSKSHIDPLSTTPTGIEEEDAMDEEEEAKESKEEQEKAPKEVASVPNQKIPLDKDVSKAQETIRMSILNPHQMLKL